MIEGTAYDLFAVKVTVLQDTISEDYSCNHLTGEVITIDYPT
jgi:hypothetical protein